ncbi:MAG: hypothetical protein JXQ76_12485 [Campylobacterales bacterium]|nr:hypothetical protein [Campylobacterales bacterium]
MKPCLIAICQDYEKLKGFLKEPTKEQWLLVDKLFFDFLECFSGLREEKLEFPKEFAHDVSLYLDGFEPLVKKFEDKQIRYLMLSDFYDYARLTKKYRP